MVAPTPSSQAIKTPAAVTTGESVHLSFCDPDINLQLPLLDFRFVRENGEIIARAALDHSAALSIRVTGRLVASGSEFRPEQVGLGIEASGDDSHTYFVGSTFLALLALTQVGLRIPAVGLACERLSFELPLKQISEHLSTRETAYKLMVIGRATGNRLDFPPKLTGHEVHTLKFMYRAIVDRTFDWPLTMYPFVVSATAEEFARWSALKQPASVTFIDDLAPELLGRRIWMGKARVTLKEAVIKDRDRFLNELALADGHQVRAVVRALDGRETIECPEAPRLPPNPWRPDERALIELWPILCDRLADRYHALAAATLAGLTEEEKAEITARPELDEDAHLMGDED